MSDEGRWVDGMMPDEPEWVRDMVDDELQRRDARIAELAASMSEKVAASMAEKLMREYKIDRGFSLRIAELERENEKLMLRSVGAMAIAEGDEGYEQVPLDCPMLVAVSALRAQLRAARGAAVAPDEAWLRYYPAGRTSPAGWLAITKVKAGDVRYVRADLPRAGDAVGDQLVARRWDE